MRRRSQLGLATALTAALALHATAGTPVGQTYVASFDWTENDPSFGGLSAIELSDDGLTFTAMSDRSVLFTGTLQRGTDGHIEQVLDVSIHPLRGFGSLLSETENDDSEGLAIAPDGTIFISQEGPARVLRLTGPDAEVEMLPVAPAFRGMQTNSSLEALAIDAQGALYTLPERSGAEDRPFPVFKYANGTWTKAFTIPRDGDYLPTGADFGPDGKLYILERNFQGLAGFQSRVRRFSANGEAGETVLETDLGQHGNLEGLSVWRDANNAIRLTMVSDDNYRFFLRTTLVEYTITD